MANAVYTLNASRIITKKEYRININMVFFFYIFTFRRKDRRDFGLQRVTMRFFFKDLYRRRSKFKHLARRQTIGNSIQSVRMNRDHLPISL